MEPSQSLKTPGSLHPSASKDLITPSDTCPNPIFFTCSNLVFVFGFWVFFVVVVLFKVKGGS
jgi:hypothetical protein